MAATGKIAASAVSATNEVNLGLANFNIDFSLITVERQGNIETFATCYPAVGLENAEQDPMHRTARRLGALFESILPSNKTLAEAYGRRASEIAGVGKSNRQVHYSTPDGRARLSDAFYGEQRTLWHGELT